MSIALMTVVFQRVDLPPNQKIMLLRMADAADDDGRGVYLSVGRIAHESGISKRTVQNVLREFERDGVVAIDANYVGGRGKSRVYRIDIDRAQELHPLPGWVRAKEGPDGGSPGVEKGADPAPFSTEKGADRDAKGCKSSAPKPLEEPNQQTTAPRPLTGAPPPLGAGRLSHRWAGNRATRRAAIQERRNPMARSEARDLIPIGSPVRQTKPTQENAASAKPRSTTWPPVSPPTSQSAEGEPRHGSAGRAATAPGAIGSGGNLPSPAEIDDNLPAWLPPPVASSISPDWGSRLVGPRELDQREPYIKRWGFKGLACSEPEARAALAVLEGLDRPADLAICVVALSRLKLKTRWRGLDAADLEVQIGVFAEDLQAYPADAVTAACEDWAGEEIFFPAWAELRALCEQHVLKRRSLATVLRSWLAEQRAKAEARAAREATKPTAYNTPWREAGEAMQAAVGSSFWQLWCADLIPVDPAKDDHLLQDDQVYHLAVRSEFIAEALPQQAAFEDLARAFGRPLAVHYRPWAAEAWRGAAQMTDGEAAPALTVTSPAERWLAKEREILAQAGRWYGIHGAHLHPLGEDGESFTVGVRNEVRFDQLRGQNEWHYVGHALGLPIQLRLIEAAGQEAKEAAG